MHDLHTGGALAAIIGSVVYLGHVALWPYRPCPVCHGHGRIAHPLSRRAVRPCQVCQTTGLQPRLAYRIYRNHRDRKENQR